MELHIELHPVSEDLTIDAGLYDHVGIRREDARLEHSRHSIYRAAELIVFLCRIDDINNDVSFCPFNCLTVVDSGYIHQFQLRKCDGIRSGSIDIDDQKMLPVFDIRFVDLESLTGKIGSLEVHAADRCLFALNDQDIVIALCNGDLRCSPVG